MVEDSGLPPVCNPGSSWSPGDQAFTEASSDWGLDEIPTSGVRIDAVDFDGDGWTDLAVRDGSGAVDLDAGTQQIFLLRNTGEGSFEDVTEASGIVSDRDSDDPTVGTPGSVWIWADVDNDGDLDVYTGVPDYDGSYDQDAEVRLNNGDGTFTLGPQGGQNGRPVDGVYGAAFGDVDLDGEVDLWTGHYNVKQDRLYKGEGDGSFEDVSKTSGLTTEEWSSIAVLNAGEAHSNAWAAAICDLNDDGAPELLTSSYGRAPNHLWLNDGSGAFTNHSVESGYAYDDRMDWSDNESARCWCTLHPEEDDCAGVPEPEAISCTEDADAFRWDHTYDREEFRLGGNSGGTTCADIDNDGDVDLMTSEIVHWDVGLSSDPSEVLLNNGDATFSRPGNEVTGLTREHDGITWDDGDITNSVFDFDNDGWPDIYIGSTDYVGTRGLLYHQIAPAEFEAVDIEDGVDHTRSHGSAQADFDRDGDLDLVVGHSSARCSGYDDCYESKQIRFFENLAEDSNFLQVALTGTGGSNTAAIGARVRVTADGVTQTQHVSGGGGQFGNQSDLVLHFGLGEACEAEVEVRWPDADGTTESFTLGGGYRYAVVQGEGANAEP